MRQSTTSRLKTTSRLGTPLTSPRQGNAEVASPPGVPARSVAGTAPRASTTSSPGNGARSSGYGTRHVKRSTLRRASPKATPARKSIARQTADEGVLEHDLVDAQVAKALGPQGGEHEDTRMLEAGDVFLSGPPSPPGKRTAAPKSVRTSRKGTLAHQKIAHQTVTDILEDDFAGDIHVVEQRSNELSKQTSKQQCSDSSMLEALPQRSSGLAATPPKEPACQLIINVINSGGDLVGAFAVEPRATVLEFKVHLKDLIEADVRHQNLLYDGVKLQNGVRWLDIFDRESIELMLVVVAPDSLRHAITQQPEEKVCKGSRATEHAERSASDSSSEECEEYEERERSASFDSMNQGYPGSDYLASEKMRVDGSLPFVHAEPYVLGTPIDLAYYDKYWVLDEVTCLGGSCELANAVHKLYIMQQSEAQRNWELTRFHPPDADLRSESIFSNCFAERAEALNILNSILDAKSLSMQDPELDRAMGSFMGMFLGDSLGSPLEFSLALDEKDLTDTKSPLLGPYEKAPWASLHVKHPYCMWRTEYYHRRMEFKSLKHAKDPAHSTGPYDTSEGVDYYYVGESAGDFPHARKSSTNRRDKRDPIFTLDRGHWTDDSSMGMCLADSLLSVPPREGFNPPDLRLRFSNWWKHGYNNAFRTFGHGPSGDEYGSVGLGGGISKSILWQSIDPTKVPPYMTEGREAGNGVLMRLAAVPVYGRAYPARAMELARRQSKTTHPAVVAHESAVFWTWLMIAAQKSDIDRSQPFALRQFLDPAVDEYIAKFRKRPDDPFSGEKRYREQLTGVIGGKKGKNGWRRGDMNWRDDDPDGGFLRRVMTARGREDDPRQFPSNRAVQTCATYNSYPVNPGYEGSYVVDAMGMALYNAYRAKDIFQAAYSIVNMRGDSDTTGAICLMLVGSFYGYTHLTNAFPTFMEELEKHDSGGDVKLKAVLLEYACRAYTNAKLQELVGPSSGNIAVKDGCHSESFE